MATYLTSPAHERLSKFFGKFLRAMREAPPDTHGQFLLRAEEEFVLTGYREKISAGVENILVVRLDAIGDMILTSGFIRELRRNFPHARITLVVSPLVYPIVELCPYVNEVLTFDIKTLNGAVPEALEQIASFCQKHLWRRKFSIAFLPQWGSANLSGLFLAWMSGARERIGYGANPYASWGYAPSAEDAAKDNFLLTKNILTPRSIIVDIEKIFYLLTAAGLAVEQNHLELFYGAADVLRARELLKNLPPAYKKVVLGIGAGDPRRRYPVEKYLVALQTLARKNLAFVIVGGKDDIDAATYLEKNLPSGKVINLAGKTTLRETEAVVSRADYYVGNGTGVLHIAAAAKIPCLALYREAQDKENYLPGIFSEFQRFPPWQTNSVILRPDHQLAECAALPPIHGWCHSKEAHCITQITPQEIVAGFEVLQSL